MTRRGRRAGRARAAARAAGLVAVLTLAACGGTDGPDATLTATAPVAPTGAPTTAVTGGDAGDLGAKDVLAATGASVVYITTPLGTGSGVLLTSGHVVTSAHVVEPFAEVTLTFADGSVVSRVPVVGADGWSDIAVLGPLTTSAPALDLAEGGSLEQGDPVYLLGYPSESEERPTPTITSGILSRVREAPEFGVTYLQTDATIAGGQSGGALVDQRGRVVGITGFSVEGFSVAVDGGDVNESVRAILDGKTDPYRTLPQGPGAPTGTVRIDADHPSRQLYLPASSTERTVTIRLGDTTTPWFAYDLFEFTTLASNGVAEETFIATLPADEQDAARADVTDVITPDADGRFSFTVPADVYTMVQVGPFGDRATGLDVTYEMDPAPIVVEGLDPVRPIARGDDVEGTLNEFDNEHLFELNLTLGDAVDVSLLAPAGSVGFTIEGPGVDPSGNTPGSYAEAEESSFSGSRAEATFVAPGNGRYLLYVFNADYLLVSYRLTVR